VDKWFSHNYNKLKTICKSVSKENDVDELLHFCIDILISNDKFNNIVEDSGKIYYFTRVVINNWKSTSSPYYTTYRKDKPKIIDYDIELPNIEGEEEVEIDMDWVRKQLEELKVKDWYYARLFELYIDEECSLTKLNKRTTIPLAPLSRDINKVRTILKEKRKKDLYGL
jgi:hypothetical protein